jgi:CBS domain-containing protein
MTIQVRPGMELAKNLRIDSVSRLNPTAPRQISPSCSVAQAVTLMRQERVGCLLICVAEQVVGIFTERDLMRRVLAANKPLSSPISDFMTANPIVVHPKDSISAAVRRMEEGGYRHLPVVNDGGRPVGILSAKRIVHYLVEHFPATVYNLPPDPGVVPQEREGA